MALLHHNLTDTADPETTPASNPERSPQQIVLDVQLVFLIVAFLMVAVGVTGNSIIIISGFRLPLTRKKGVTSGSRYYIINLALADLGFLFVASITNLVSMLHTWKLGSFMCKLLLPLRDVFMLASLATISALSVERYWLITRPLQHIPNKSAAKFVVFSIWLVSYVVNGVPLLLITRLHEVGDLKICTFDWPSEKIKKIHICFGVVIILATFAIVSFCYIAIGMSLKEVYKKRSETMHEGHDKAANKHAVSLILRSKRLVKMLIVVVVTFSICNLPAVLYVLAHVFHDVNFKHQEVLRIFFVCMIVSGSSFNPIILLMMASEYRLCIVEFGQLLKMFRNYCCTCRLCVKEPPDQRYCEILHDRNLPSTPV